MNAMRAKDKFRAQVIKSVVSELSYNDKSGKKAMEPQLVVLKAVKQREDAAAAYRAGDRMGIS